MNEECFVRRKTKSIFIGNVGIGHEHPVSIQSMTNTDTKDVTATLAQIRELATNGCMIVRLAVLDYEACEALKAIIEESPLPVVADIHFDHRLALKSIEYGVHGLRINPGNIGPLWKVKEVVKAAQERNIPMRIGVNSGSVEKELLDKYGGISDQAMVESALKHIRILEDLGYEQIKVSLKASHVPLMIKAYRMIAGMIDYPLHLGVTEAGLVEAGSIKSSIGIGSLLAEGIGDTVRVSLTGDPVPEIRVAKTILRTLGLMKTGAEIISCPTCGRCQLDLYSIAKTVEDKLKDLTIPITVAIMGCAVNGPGEAREADLGIAGGKGEGLIFVKGQVIRKVPEDELVQALFTELDKLIDKGE